MLIITAAQGKLLPQAVWRRYAVKMGVRVSQVKLSNCFRRLEKLVFTFRFWHKSFIVAALSNNNFEWRMWHFRGSKRRPILWPLLYIFGDQRPPKPLGIYAPVSGYYYIKLLIKVVLIIIHFSCCSWCRGGSRTRCIPQRIEIRGVGWSLCVCSHCLRELGSTKRFSSPAPFGPWPKIDWHFRRNPRNQLPVSEIFSPGTAL